MNPIVILTVAEVIPLFKGDVEANNIEKITFQENGFHVVSGKG